MCGILSWLKQKYKTYFLYVSIWIELPLTIICTQEFKMAATKDHNGKYLSQQSLSHILFLTGMHILIQT